MPSITEEIETAATKWMQAWVRRDLATLESCLAPDFALILSAVPGSNLDRANWLGTATTRYTATEFRYRDVQVRDLQGGIAVMSSIAEFEAEIDGVARTGPLFVVDVWRWMDGRWRVCGRYSSNPEEARASATEVTKLA